MFHDEKMMDERRKRWKEMSVPKRMLLAAGWAALMAAALGLVGLVVMLLWNRIMSATLGLPALGYWEAIGLFILLKILLGGRGGSFLGKMRMRRLMRERMARQDGSAEGTGD